MKITLRTLCGCERVIEAGKDPGTTWLALLIEPRGLADWQRTEPDITAVPVRRRAFRREEFIYDPESPRAIVYLEQPESAPHLVHPSYIAKDLYIELEHLRNENLALKLMNASLRKALDGVVGASIDIVKDLVSGRPSREE